MMSSRIGTFYPLLKNYTDVNGYDNVIKTVQKADSNELDFFWTVDIEAHAMNSSNSNPSVINAALSMITSKIGLRGESSIAGNQDPLRITEEWSVIDNTSKGRVGLSIDSCTIDEAAKRIEEKIKAVRTLWQGGSVVRKNGAEIDVELKTFPKPIQKELPLWVSIKNNNELMYKMAGAMKANILVYCLEETVESLAEKINAYRKAYGNQDHTQGIVSLILPAYLIDKEEKLKAAESTELITYLDYVNSFYKTVCNIDLEKEKKYLTYANSLVATKKSSSDFLKQVSSIGVNEIVGILSPKTSPNKTLELLSFLKKSNHS
ncbi:LLM class flavin-dependent oxidoreductase [Tenacibaculum sp. FZY0031]|uniref:LLM class flavin-dependent oxidoreductase n=1 Tax=unclassified Tenacibaculum TaxID=2635139 RepID=UPI002EC01612|nr:LLM class flavin-dependent oxidoreductase [Tenacibaculum sp. FZY0031]